MTGERSKPDTELDRRFMAAAIRIGRRMRGQTWPNPAVGALIVRNDDRGPVVVGQGATARGGRPHAEAIALEEAGERARGATMYVSLEPCAWRSDASRNRPCADLLITAGIARVVIGTQDPHPETAGRSVAFMRTTGVSVDVGILSDEAERAHRGHIRRMSSGLPFVTLKLAASGDGMIGRKGTGQVAITGEATRRLVHRMRADHDAILIGSGTALADDPQLTCRLPGLSSRSPVRIVLDRRARLPVDANLARTTAEAPVWLVCGPAAEEGRTKKLSSQGVNILRLPQDAEPADLRSCLSLIAEQGITTVMVEGGATVARALVDQALADEVVLFRSPRTVGDEGILAFGNCGPELLSDKTAYELAGEQSVGDDRALRYVRHA